MAALGAIVCALAVLGRSGASELPGATQGFATRAVHGGTEPLDDNGAIVPCISLATTFAQTQPGVKRGIGNPNSHGSGFFYSRQANPTRGAFERGLASLESAKHCIAFSSGQAATSAVVSLMSGRTGDHVIALNDLYGGTTAMFQQFADQSSGIDFTYTSLTDLDRVETAITSRTRMIWLETPTNPNLMVTDIAAVVALAKKHSLLVVVDNTFLSPYLQNPLALGADVVVHSVTKYIAGHSDVLMGAVLTNNDQVCARLRSAQNFMGAVPSPFDCYLAMRGMRTLHLRVERASANAKAVAEFLQSHPKVERVVYPGLPSHPQFDLVSPAAASAIVLSHMCQMARQARGGGAMVTFFVRGDKASAHKVLSALKLITLAVSLGAVESLACCPAIMTHNSVSAEVRLAAGVTDNLIRLSVGVEDAKDLIDDLAAALDGI